MYTVKDLVKSYVHGFGSPLAKGLINDANGVSMIYVNWYCRLWMTHFNECFTEGNIYLTTYKDGTSFRFGGRCHYVFQNDTQDMDSIIKGWDMTVGGQKRNQQLESELWTRKDRMHPNKYVTPYRLQRIEELD